jgi:hypothetical protein
MSGHVFHPGHSELHGITVVLEADEVVYVGRYHEETPRGVLLHDVAEHRGGGAGREEFIRKTLKFGVRAQHPHVIVPAGDVRRVVRLVDYAGDSR